MNKTILGKEIGPGDKIVIRGSEQIIESTYQSSNGEFNHLRLTSGLVWPVKNNEKLIFIGKADLIDLTGVPENER